MPTKRCDDEACDMRQGTFTYESTDHLAPQYVHGHDSSEVEQMLAEGWTLTYHNHGRNA